MRKAFESAFASLLIIPCKFVSHLCMATRPSKILETFANPSPQRDYWVRMEIPEFTCLCPLTGQPDFATMVIDFVPDKRNVELKSLKLYMWSYRNEGAFHEAVTNAILDDLVKAIAPALHAPDCKVVRARRDFHDRDG